MNSTNKSKAGPGPSTLRTLKGMAIMKQIRKKSGEQKPLILETINAMQKLFRSIKNKDS